MALDSRPCAKPKPSVRAVLAQFSSAHASIS